ncbi:MULTISPECIES: hypothetical protein [Sorangium]
MTNLKWIEVGKNKVKLDAPTGSAIVKAAASTAWSPSEARSS